MILDKIFVEEAVSELHTLQDVIRWTVSRFNAAGLFYGHGTDNAWDEAVQLILPTLYLPIDVPSHVLNSRLTSSERLRIVERVIKRINERTPTAYLTNKAWFCGLEFFVDERVLVPRSPIGELIEAQFQPWLTEEPTRIMDLCTGSGCIAIALKKKLPYAKVFAIDISENALEVAQKNAKDNDVEVQFVQADVLSLNDLHIFKNNDEPFHIFVSNPPYVRNLEKAEMRKNVLEYEPDSALFVEDNNPLVFYDKIANLAMKYLKINGSLYFEINQYLGKEMIDLLDGKQFQNIELRKDIFGVDRMLKADI